MSQQFDLKDFDFFFILLKSSQAVFLATINYTLVKPEAEWANNVNQVNTTLHL